MVRCLGFMLVYSLNPWMLVHAAGFTPGVLTISLERKVTIPRDKLGGIPLAVEDGFMFIQSKRPDTFCFTSQASLRFDL